MTDAFTHNVSDEPLDNKHSPASEEDALAELCALLFSPEQTDNNQQPSSDDYQSPEQEVLAELRALLLNQEQAKVESSQQQPQSHSSDNNPAPKLEEDALGELRRLLIAPEQTQLNHIQERFENPRLYAQELSKVLPEAIILLSLQENEQLTKALLPTIETAIQISVKKDINVLANAIFPVIGPAIRKSINVSLNALIQSLNQALEYSVSVKSFKWRLEALQTGKSFAEVVLLRTLIYRVEQVFLIHKETGLVLQHIVAPAVMAQDADLVSAMLKAIQDFVHDSFNMQQNESLDSLHFGELTIWIEQGPKAILAGVFRGNAPHDLRSVFQEVIERIHSKFHEELTAFNGDDSAFEGSREDLESCIQVQYYVNKKEQKKSFPLFKILGGSVLLILAVWVVVSFQQRQRWLNYVEKLNSQPGIIVVNAEKRQGKYFISGLRDPLAVDPAIITKQAKLNPKMVFSKWEPYLSFDATFIAARAKKLLQPPQTVSLKVDSNGILYATGSAPRQWLLEAQKVVRGIPGVTQFNTKNLIETDYKQLEISRQLIERQVLSFAEGKTQLEPNQSSQLDLIAKEIEKLTTSAPFYRKDVHIQIVGHTSDRGSEEKNLFLSQRRAYAILSALELKGVKTNNVRAVGVGIKAPLFNQLKQKEEKLNRSVTFNVFLTDALNRQSTNP